MPKAFKLVPHPQNQPNKQFKQEVVDLILHKIPSYLEILC